MSCGTAIAFHCTKYNTEQYGLTEGGFVLVRLLQRFDRIETVSPVQDMDQKLYKTIIVAKDGLRIRLHKGN